MKVSLASSAFAKVHSHDHSLALHLHWLHLREIYAQAYIGRCTWLEIDSSPLIIPCSRSGGDLLPLRFINCSE